MLRFILLVLLLVAGIVPTGAGACISSAALGIKLAAYAVRAISLGVPRHTIGCVFRAVHAERRRGGCVDVERLGGVMGDAMPACVMRLGGPDAIRVPLDVRPLRRPLHAAELPRSARLPWAARVWWHRHRRRMRRRRRTRCVSWCNCYCDSGCHYCCAYSGTRIANRPGARCFYKAGCPRKLAKCTR